MTPTAPAGIRQPGILDFALLLLLAFFWGSSFFFIKQGVDNGLPPLSLAVGRMTIGAVMLVSIALARGQSVPCGRGVWGRLILLGVIGNSLPFFLIAWGEQFTTSQLAAILMATIPCFVIVLAHFLTHDEPLTLGKGLGAALGFAGVIAIVGVDALKGLGDQVVGQLAIVGGCLSYSFYGILVRRVPSIGPEMLVGTILVGGLVPLVPVWLVVDRPWELTGALAPTGGAWLSMVWLGVLSTGGGNLLFYLLLRRVGAGFGSFNNYVVPLMGLGWGYALAGERPSWNALLALVLILSGLAAARLLRPARGVTSSVGSRPEPHPGAPER